jgi:hypothetical protein
MAAYGHSNSADIWSERTTTEFLDDQNGQEYAPPGKEIWRQRTEWVGDYSLPSRTAIINVADINVADAQRRTAIA